MPPGTDPSAVLESRHRRFAGFPSDGFNFVSLLRHLSNNFNLPINPYLASRPPSAATSLHPVVGDAVQVALTISCPEHTCICRPRSIPSSTETARDSLCLLSRVQHCHLSSIVNNLEAGLRLAIPSATNSLRPTTRAPFPFIRSPQHTRATRPTLRRS